MDSKYYVVEAWYVPKENPDRKPYDNMQAIISNTVYVDCKSHSRAMVEIQFTEYFDAYYREEVGASYLKHVKAYQYDSSHDAERSRRKDIASLKQYKNLLSVNEFSVLCDN
ncbi:hypothetical protein [Mariniflexile sp.]|uniref:hypothetical protein n=1 Tax=Mariniflexile sp. TaxID=1979402 RepID=UPI0040478247